MKKKYLIGLLSILFVLGVGVVLYFRNSPTTEVDYTDQDLISAFHRSDRFPPDFSYEQGGNFLSSRSILHSQKKAEVPDYLLCTDDSKQALEWVRLTLRSKEDYVDDIYTRLTNSSETEKSFVFTVRAREGNKPENVFKISKCSYFESNVEQSSKNKVEGWSIVGRYNVRPINETGIKELAAYLWSSSRGGRCDRVLGTSTGQDFSSYYHSVYQLCDVHYDTAFQSEADKAYERVDLNLEKFIYAIDKESGDVKVKKEAVTTVKGYRYKR